MNQYTVEWIERFSTTIEEENANEAKRRARKAHQDSGKGVAGSSARESRSLYCATGETDADKVERGNE